ncbi:MAG: hypothetical protein ACLQOZ_09650 [Acidimicrobiales bacterium]
MTPWKRAVRTKIAALGLAWLLWFGLLTVVHAYHFAIIASGGQARTMAEADPGIARAMLVGFALLLLVETCSLTWRAVRHSSRIGVNGIIIAGLSCTAPLLFAFTPIGFLLLPFAALGVFLALPIGHAESKVSNTLLVAPPGWYANPLPGSQFRYWDGTTWTPWTA